MARKVDESWTKCRIPTDLDWTRAFAHDSRDPRCLFWSRVTLQTNTERGSVVRDVPFVYITFLVTLLE